MRVMVTGGAGYIGSVVSAELVRDGHEVVIYDNLSKGHREAVPLGAKFVEGNILDTRRLAATLESSSIDAVVHMAAWSLVGDSVRFPEAYYRNNVMGSLSLLDAMLAAGVKKVVFSSTAAVYGEPEAMPITEEFPTEPTNTYGDTKLAFERALAWYERAYGIRYASLRYFNAAGASRHLRERHEPETHLIPLVLRAALGETPCVRIFGDDYATRDGTCLRDYIHVVDLARAHILALSILDERSAIYNLGCGGEGYTVREVIDVAREVTGREIPVEVVARRAGDPARLVASSDKIRRELGWQPTLDLRAMVQSAWEALCTAERTSVRGTSA